jgi:hypothetical protein
VKSRAFGAVLMFSARGPFVYSRRVPGSWLIFTLGRYIWFKKIKVRVHVLLACPVGEVDYSDTFMRRADGGRDAAFVDLVASMALWLGEE